MVVYYGHGNNSDMQCGLTWARTVTMVGRRGRRDGGEAVGDMDWLVVWRGRCASTAEAHNDGDGSMAQLWHARVRETRGGASERMSWRAWMRDALQSVPDYDVA